ncbi:hypothetical protein [Rubripirellula amarantea]|nr:hypothetical protein [Rubripirellula amarantea]
MMKSDRMPLLLAAILVVTLGYAAITGRLTPHHVADTPSYLNYPLDSLHDALLSPRTPAYPIFLGVMKATLGLAVVPLIQWIISALAAWAFAVEMRRYGSTVKVAWAIGFAIALSCTALDHQSTLATDAIAASVGIWVVTMLLRWHRTERGFKTAIAIIGLSFLAIMIRPAYLALIPFLGIAGTLIMRMSGGTIGRGLTTSLTPVLGICLCVIGWMGLRGAVVDDFAILPFGHQNLAGVTFQLVSDEELRAVSPSSSELIEAILAARDDAKRRGFDLADDGGQVGMTSATMTIEARWNDLIYQAIAPAANQQYPDDAVRAHREIAKVNKAIVAKYPLRYARWIALATRRAIWGTVANWLMNPFFLAATLIALGIALERSIRSTPESVNMRHVNSTTGPNETPSSGDAAGKAENNAANVGANALVGIESRAFTDNPIGWDSRVLFVVAMLYAICMIGFVILTTPPLGRFADAGAILIPAWIAQRAIKWCC